MEKQIKEKISKKRGITLITLVVTIIILLIITGITLIMITGENGLMSRTQEAKKRMDKEEVKERVQVEASGTYDKNGFNMEQFKENIEKNLGVDPNDIIESEDGNLTFPLDGYIVGVKKDEDGDINVQIEGDGSKESLPTPPDLQESNTKIIFSPNWTKEPVEVTIETHVEGNNVLQYSIDEGTTWIRYTKPFNVTENNTTIMARLWNRSK